MLVSGDQYVSFNCCYGNKNILHVASTKDVKQSFNNFINSFLKFSKKASSECDILYYVQVCIRLD